MKSVFEYFCNSGYTVEAYIIRNINARCLTCHACNKSVDDSVAYLFTDHRLSDIQTFFLHESCAELPISVYLHEHPLCLKEDIIFGEDAACHICHKPVVGSPTYTCSSHDVDCQNFYLHKICAELPMKTNHHKHKHNTQPLSLLPRPDGYVCSVCTSPVKTCYACDDCEFNVCAFCAFEQRVLQHEGHMEHTLTLMKKESLFQCDACHEEAKDSSYVCTTCEFWIHRSCAFSPSIIPDPTYHHHPLTLVYSIPDIHCYFKQFCGICHEYVYKSYWVYYCQKCTYFVHMKCSKSTASMRNKDEEDDIDKEPDLVLFPLASQESMFDLIVTQCSKFQVDFHGQGENSVTMSTTPSQIIEKHWSHEIHPLQQLQCSIIENNKDDNDDRRVLICDGCIQPITVSHPSYYACFQCDFFLHFFCATMLPQKLLVGASHFHPNHSLLLQKIDKFYNHVNCGVCDMSTNGFYYHCQICDIHIDIVCAFLPTRIKHKSHKHHALVQRPSSNSTCSISGLEIGRGMEYACETCDSFRIHKNGVFLPSRVEHKYDVHPITLRYPPFFYEGVLYCEICEERVNNQKLLYHCTESGHSYHCYCGILADNVKLGGSIKVVVVDKAHTLALVSKSLTKKKSIYTCFRCFERYNTCYNTPALFFECDGCGFLACINCAGELLDEQSAVF